MQQASVVLDSTSPQDLRLTTFLVRYPKFIHGEVMTHRVFTRNASSSRAIPTSKFLEEVRSDHHRAKPIWWGKNEPGMQAWEELDDSVNISTGNTFISARMRAQGEWAEAAHQAALAAERLMEIGAHKQIVNRILEPFLHINVLITATEYMNFFGLRLDEDAQPEIRDLAEKMWAAYNESKPQLLNPGEWHLPFIDIRDDGSLDDRIKVSVARCARLSYMSNETKKRSTVEEDLKLYDRLLRRDGKPIHASPAEHQATPDFWHGAHAMWLHPMEHGNYKGWRQYRKMIPGESCAPLPARYSGK